jgi:hypothetical protein
MENKIVLGFPYAGAFLWLLSAEEYYRESIKGRYKGTHSYYVTMFGSNHNKIIDETVSLTLLFDEIYLAPVDTHLPDKAKYSTGNNYMNFDLGIYMDWEWDKEVRTLFDHTDFFLEDPVIQNTLKRVPPGAKTQILHEALNQINISNKFNAAIFANHSYLELCQRLNAIIDPSSSLKTQNSAIPSSAINTVYDLASLKFSIDNLDEFIMLRQAHTVKQYSHFFRNYVQELPNGTLNKSVLYKAMLHAINSDETLSKISGGFSLTSTLTSLLTLVPLVGTAVGLAGIGADLSSRIAHSRSEKSQWWLMAPEISKLLTKKRIEELQSSEE